MIILAGCSGSETREESIEEDNEIVGTWKCEVSHDNPTEDTTSDMTYEFNEDGTYKLTTNTMITDENGETINDEISSEGRYTIDGSKINI